MSYVVPLLYVVLLWWASTVVLLHRSGRPAATFPTTIGWALVAAAFGAAAIIMSRGMDSVAGAYLAFTGALAIWALHEISYLLGYVTGPRAAACPDDVSTFERFCFGVRASLWHELAILATVVAIAAVTRDSPNPVALLTFVVLWLMRWSTKLNIFLGVRNLHEEYWPVHLEYLKSYTRERPMNALFPWSVVAALAVTAAFVSIAAAPDASVAEQTGAMLLVGILLLAIVEHVFLMLPIPDDALWRVATRSRQAP